MQLSQRQHKSQAIKTNVREGLVLWLAPFASNVSLSVDSFAPDVPPVCGLPFWFSSTAPSSLSSLLTACSLMITLFSLSAPPIDPFFFTRERNEPKKLIVFAHQSDLSGCLSGGSSVPTNRALLCSFRSKGMSTNHLNKVVQKTM